MECPLPSTLHQKNSLKTITTTKNSLTVVNTRGRNCFLTEQYTPASLALNYHGIFFSCTLMYHKPFGHTPT